MSTHCVTSSRLVLKTSYPQMKAHAGSAVPPRLSLPATTLAASISVVTDLSAWGNLDAQHHTLWALYGFFHLPLFSSLVHVSIYQYFVSIYFKIFIRFYDECVVQRSELAGVNYFFLPCGSRGWTKVSRLAGQAPLPTEPNHQPHFCFLSHGKIYLT